MIAHHLHPEPASVAHSAQTFRAEMAASVHSDDEEQADFSEPGEDGYWPAIEILKERKHDYLVNWDGINPETGRAWTPSWTGKSEVTEDLIEAWEAIKYATRKNTRRSVFDSVRLWDKR